MVAIKGWRLKAGSKNGSNPGCILVHLLPKFRIFPVFFDQVPSSHGGSHWFESSAAHTEGPDTATAVAGPSGFAPTKRREAVSEGKRNPSASPEAPRDHPGDAARVHQSPVASRPRAEQ